MSMSSPVTLPLPKPKEYRLGYEVEHEGKKALVTRIVDSTAVFEDRRKRYSVSELYVELQDEDGVVHFVELRRKREPLPVTEGVTLKAPEPLLWKEDV